MAGDDTQQDKPLTKKQIREKLIEMEDAILEVAKVGRALRESKLKQRTIVILISEATKVSRRDVRAVLDILPDFDKRFLNLGGKRR